MCHEDEIKTVAVSFRVDKESLSDGAQRGKETRRSLLLYVSVSSRVDRTGLFRRWLV